MLPYRDSRLTKIALIVFFIIVIIYAYYEAQGALFGPQITISSSVTEVSDPFIVISGHADRIASLSMNGQAIAVTEDGSFQEPYLLAPGYNRITLDAKDRYARQKREVLEIVYTPAPSSLIPPPTATSTPASTSAPVAQ